MPKSLPCCHFLFFSADINHHTWWDRPVRSPETIQSNGYFQLRTGLQNHNPWVRTWPAIPNQYASWTLNHAEPSGQWHFIVELVPLKDLQGPIAPWHLMPAGMKDSTVHWTCRTLLCHGSLQIIPSAEILINYKKQSGTFLLQSWVSLTAGILDTKAWNEQSGRHGHFYPPIIACRLSCCLWIPQVHLYLNKSAHIMHMPCKFHAFRTIHPRWSRLSGELHI